MDALRRELARDDELNRVTAKLAEWFSDADVEAVDVAAKSGDSAAIAAALNVEKHELEEVVGVIGGRARHYARYPDLALFDPNRRQRPRR